eukprot:Pgem_evm1s14343
MAFTGDAVTEFDLDFSDLGEDDFNFSDDELLNKENYTNNYTDNNENYNCPIN